MTPRRFVSLTTWGLLLLAPGVTQAGPATTLLTVGWSAQCCGYQYGYSPTFASYGSYYGGYGSYYGGGYGACQSSCGYGNYANYGNYGANYGNYGCGSGCNYGFAPSYPSNYVSYGYGNYNNCAPAGCNLSCNNNCGPVCGCPAGNCSPGCCPNGNCTLNYNSDCNNPLPKATEKNTGDGAPTELPKDDRTFKEKTPDGFGPRTEDMQPMNPNENPGDFVPPKQPENPASAPMTPETPLTPEEEQKKKEAYEKDLNETEPGLFIHLEQQVIHTVPARHSRMKVRARFTTPVVARRDQQEKPVDWKPEVQTVEVVHQD